MIDVWHPGSAAPGSGGTPPRTLHPGGQGGGTFLSFSRQGNAGKDIAFAKSFIV